MTIRKATANDLNLLINSRLEMLKDVNNLSEDAAFSPEFLTATKEYFQTSDHTTLLALEDCKVIGCASICYINVMPTFDHPTGKRAHIMNVYTHADYRRQGIAFQMMEQLMEEARKRKVTEISLDATEAGRPLYEKCGFTDTTEGMVLNL